MWLSAKQARIEAGDILEAGVVNGKITFTPKSLIDRHLDEGLEDARKGRTHGPSHSFLPANHSHPSLLAKHSEALDVWQARVIRDWRFYFKIDGDEQVILSVIPLSE